MHLTSSTCVGWHMHKSIISVCTNVCVSRQQGKCYIDCCELSINYSVYNLSHVNDSHEFISLITVMYIHFTPLSKNYLSYSYVNSFVTIHLYNHNCSPHSALLICDRRHHTYQYWFRHGTLTSVTVCLLFPQVFV